MKLFGTLVVRDLVVVVTRGFFISIVGLFIVVVVTRGFFISIVGLFIVVVEEGML